MRLRIDPQRISARKISPAVEALRAGGVVIYPTDTGYAFGCCIDKRKAIEQLRRLKGLGEREKHPLTVMVSSLQEMSNFGHMGNQAFRLIRSEEHTSELQSQ